MMYFVQLDKFLLVESLCFYFVWLFKIPSGFYHPSVSTFVFFFHIYLQRRPVNCYTSQQGTCNITNSSCFLFHSLIIHSMRNIMRCCEVCFFFYFILDETEVREREREREMSRGWGAFIQLSTPALWRGSGGRGGGRRERERVTKKKGKRTGGWWPVCAVTELPKAPGLCVCVCVCRCTQKRKECVPVQGRVSAYVGEGGGRAGGHY